MRVETVCVCESERPGSGDTGDPLFQREDRKKNRQESSRDAGAAKKTSGTGFGERVSELCSRNPLATRA